jgi:hypothetical protein
MKTAFPLLLIVLITLSCTQNKGKKETMESSELSLDSITAIAKEAYIYGYPMVDNYRIQYGYYVDSTNSEFKAPWNHLKNVASVFHLPILPYRHPTPTRLIHLQV